MNIRKPRQTQHTGTSSTSAYNPRMQHPSSLLSRSNRHLKNIDENMQIRYRIGRMVVYKYNCNSLGIWSYLSGHIATNRSQFSLSHMGILRVRGTCKSISPFLKGKKIYSHGKEHKDTSKKLRENAIYT